MDPTFSLVSQHLEQIHAPIQKGTTFRCFFTKRYIKGRNPKVKYYFFSKDQEDLIISSSVKNKKSTVYKMSLNSKEIKRKSVWFAGLCSDAQEKKIFIGSFPSKPGKTSHAIKIDHTDQDSQICLPPVGVQDFTFSDSNQEEIIFLASNKVNDNPDNPDFFTINVVANDQNVFSLRQIAEDEFDVKISHPLTIFQAFCISCVLTN